MSNDPATVWVRTAYPDGIPDDEAPALLAVLEEHLGSARARTLLGSLRDDGLLSPTGAALVLPEETRQRAVAAKLVIGGWPLARETGDEPSATDTRGASRPTASNGATRLSDRDVRDLLSLLGRQLGGDTRPTPSRHGTPSGSALGDIASVVGDLVSSLPSEQDLRRIRDDLLRMTRPEREPAPSSEAAEPTPEPTPEPADETSHGQDMSDGHWPGTDQPGPDGRW